MRSRRESGFSITGLRSKVCYIAPRLLLWAMVQWNVVISYGAKDEFEMLVKELQSTFVFLLLTVPYAKLTFLCLMNTWDNAQQ